VGARSDTRSATIAFERRFLLPGALLTAAELGLVATPVLALVDPTPAERAVLLRVLAPIVAGAALVWAGGWFAWLAPLRRFAGGAQRDSAAAYRLSYSMPLVAGLFRTAVWTGVAAAHAQFLATSATWPERLAVQVVGMTALHAFALGMLRAAWYRRELAVVRRDLFPDVSELRGFADGYRARLIEIGLLVIAGAAVAVTGFAFYFLRLTPARYLELQLLLPAATFVVSAAYCGLVALWTRPVTAYLARLEGDRPSDIRGAPRVFRRAQVLPYRLAAATIGLWLAAAAGIALLLRGGVRAEVDTAGLVFGVVAAIAVGGSLYQILWLRQAMRPLLAHLMARYRLTGRAMRAPLSLRGKLLLSFCGVVVFACFLSLFWGFSQYRNLIGEFVDRQARVGLTWLAGEVRAGVNEADGPTVSRVGEILAGLVDRPLLDNAVVLYAPPDGPVRSFGGPAGLMDALPQGVVEQMRRPRDGSVSIGDLALAGRHERLLVEWRGRRFDLGAAAILFPTHRTRGPGLGRPVKDLLWFFVGLLVACAGIAILTVADFVRPIRRIERRAEGMARGELGQPVTSGGEGDEVGRLTGSLEQMRQVLRDKLRSTEEVNLDLERAVQRRTADLARKNRELADTLEALTRAQHQLVQSEKMASIGQLVAGIAHEINNPVNAVVNTVAPLEEALGELAEGNASAAADARDMIRVIHSGANRTKDIVRALHNYSRADDESVVDVDLNRTVDDSLELLRHLLRQAIRVKRDYGAHERVRGHAGQLNQVFMNLLTNAAQAVAGRDDATIWVSTEDINDAVVVTVRDNGGGIPEDVLPRIFDPFFTTKDVGEGTGLGLSIVHGIVERHGGTIEVDSDPKRGARFRVTLPKEGPPTAQRGTVDAGADGDAATTG